MDEYFPRKTSTVNRLLEDFELNSTSSWQKRHESYVRYHSVDLSKQFGWKGVEAAIEARNSVAHGLGRLTAKQLRKRGIKAQLGLVDIQVANNELYIVKTSLPKIFSVCSSFVRAVDSAAP
nr:hypothetical protein Ade03nite_62290 [Actinoplanes derwentensis]